MALPLQGRLTGSQQAPPKKVEANCADNRHISKGQRGYFLDSATIGGDWARDGSPQHLPPCASRMTNKDDRGMTAYSACAALMRGLS